MIIEAHNYSSKQLAEMGLLKDPIYNGFDNCVTFEVDEARQRLRRNDTLIYDFERAMQGCALEMMLRGFRVNIGERETAIIKTKEKKEATEHLLSAIITAVKGSYDDKLPNSPKQLQHLFYNCMKLKPIERVIAGETKRPMNRETLERLETTNKYASPIINAILFHRDLTKTLQVLETQIEYDPPRFAGDNNWRWRCSYNIGGTSTGRWSSSKSPFGTGNNFQNINEELRRIFIPDPGMKLYGIDKSQSEARDVGWFCGTMLGDWTYLDACESGDLHTSVTRLLYPDWNWTGDIKRDKQIAQRRFYRLFTYRDASKRLGHATNYYGKPKEISRQTRIPLALVEEFQDRYFAAFPCIPRMHQWVSQQIQRERYLVNSFGRRRDFFDHPEAYDTLKSAIAYLFQSATGDCLNLGLWRLWKRMGTKIQILSQLHDAAYFQAPLCSADEEQQLLRECLDCIEVTQHHAASGRTMTIPGEVAGGYNWAHKYRLLADGTIEEWNPDGLTEIKVAA